MHDLNMGGLSQEEARASLKRAGKNIMPSPDSKGLLQTMAAPFSEPMVLLLLACSSIYFLIGDLAEGLFLAGSMGFVITISIVQQRKAENALNALRTLSSPRATVIRGGLQMRIASSEVAPGDLIVLQEGDRVPADGRVISSTHLQIDESLLTGESLPVKKVSLDGINPDRSGKVFSSTLIVKGQGLAEVTSTGRNTEVGQIGLSIKPVRRDVTRLEIEIQRLVRVLATIGIVFCGSIALIYAVTRNDWPNGLLAGLSTAMALVPEEFPLVLTIFLAMGAWRLSKINVLTRNLSAIENLGSISVLCVDKTGTLTKNEMTVRELANNHENFDLIGGSDRPIPESLHETLEFGALASLRNPFDPMEKAIQTALFAKLAGTEHIHENWSLVQEYPLSNELFAMSCVWKRIGTTEYVVATKGAPEAISQLCQLSKEETRKALSIAEVMAANGLRVLAVAKANCLHENLPDRQQDFDFSFVGLIGLEDPLRPEASAAIAGCHSAGIRVVMITGDYPQTAMKIAGRAGLNVSRGVVTGNDLQYLNDLALKERVRAVNVFARTVPDQKLRIVNALKESGEVVAMTGDGINDAPSLKWADVGIAMGGRGTDVAREASDLVLLDDQFGSIVKGIERGRNIFANIRGAMAFLFAVHVPIAGLSLVPLFFGWPLLLLPVHIAFLELLIDPTCTLVFENRARDARLMHLPPRPTNKALFAFRNMLASSVAGAIVLVTITVVAILLKWNGKDFHFVRSVAFQALVLADLGLIAIFSGISREEASRGRFLRRPFFWISVTVFLGMGIIWILEPLRSLFGLSQPSGEGLAYCLLTAALAITLSYHWDKRIARKDTIGF